MAVSIPQPQLINWEETCKVKDLRIAYLENEVSTLKMDRDLYREKLFAHLGLNQSGVKIEEDLKPIHGRVSPMALARRYEMRDRDLAKKMEDEKANLAGSK